MRISNHKLQKLMGDHGKLAKKTMVKQQSLKSHDPHSGTIGWTYSLHAKQVELNLAPVRQHLDRRVIHAHSCLTISAKGP